MLLSFVGGKPHIHHNIKTSGITYNNFYGIQCDKIIKFVTNEQPKEQKMFLALRVECKQEILNADQVFTQSGQFSIIPMDEFEMIENYYEGAFLCDENTVEPRGISALVDGDSLYGNWAKLRFVGDPNKKGDYCEILGFVISAVKSW